MAAVAAEAAEAQSKGDEAAANAEEARMKAMAAEAAEAQIKVDEAAAKAEEALRGVER